MALAVLVTSVATGQGVPSTALAQTPPGPTVDGFVRSPFTGVVEAPYVVQGITYTQDQLSGKFAGLLYKAEDANNVYLAFEQSVFMNDNTYGPNSIGWSSRRPHRLSDLLNSDRMGVKLFDKNGVLVLDFFMDYATQNKTTLIVESLGATGGDGAINFGSATNIDAAQSSLYWDFNIANPTWPTKPTDSPRRVPTNTYNLGTTADPNFPWVYETTYEFAIKKSAFGSAGFGSVDVYNIHNSPPKTGGVDVRPIPRLVIKKEANPPSGSQVSSGERITYTITATNVGTVPINNAAITDKVDTDLTSVVPLDGGTFASGTITWNVGTIALAQTVTVSFQADVKIGLITGTEILNTGKLVSPDLPTPANTNTTLHTTLPAPSLSITKTASATSSVPGGSINYTIVVSNTGDGSATNLVVTDNPNETYVASVSAISVPGTYDGNIIAWNLPDLSPASSVTVSYTATLKAASTGVFLQGTTNVVNTATVDALETNPISVTKTVTVTTAANLTIKKTASPTSSAPGASINYTITISNTGEAPASNVVATDNPDETYVVSVSAISGGGVYSLGIIKWNLGTLNPGSSASVSYTATLKAASTGVFPQGATNVVNPASVVSTQTPTPVTATATVAVNAAVNLTIAKSASPTSSVPGGNINYSITVTNTGDAPATGVVVTDDPDETYVASVSAISGGGTYSAGIITWNLGTMNPGAILTRTYTATLKGPAADVFPAGTTNVVNTATVDSNQEAPKSDQETVAVTAKVILGLSKVTAVAQVTATLTNSASVNASNYLTGASASVSNTLVVATDITYTLVVTNTGDASAQGVVLVDTLPAGMTVISNPNFGVVSGDTVTWTIGTIAAGGSATVSVTVRTQTP
jgi:uncharacterized repeat protein (TIGR01451 family)